MTPLVVAGIALTVAFAATVQTAIGFGFGLVLVPVVLALGRSLPEAVAIALGAGLWQALFGLYAVRSEVRWRRAWPLAFAQWSALPIGLAAMAALDASGPARVQQGVGAVLIAVLTARIAIRPEPREQVARGWALFAGVSSGVLSGAVGMGGPPLVLLGLSQRLSADGFRALLWEQFLLVTPVQLAVLAFRFGLPMLEAFGLGLALVPMLYAGTRLGRALSGRWQASTLSRAAVVMLYLLAVVSLLAPRP